MSRDYWEHCPQRYGQKCRVPTIFVQPDVSCILEETGNPTANAGNGIVFNWKIPVLTVEIVGSKDPWGRDEGRKKAYISACYSLQFYRRAYCAVVTSQEIVLYQLKRNAVTGQIDSKHTSFDITSVGGMRSACEGFLLALQDVVLLQYPDMMNAAWDMQFIHKFVCDPLNAQGVGNDNTPCHNWTVHGQAQGDGTAGMCCALTSLTRFQTEANRDINGVGGGPAFTTPYPLNDTIV